MFTKSSLKKIKKELDERDSETLEYLKTNNKCQERVIVDNGQHYIYCGAYYVREAFSTKLGLRCAEHGKGFIKLMNIKGTISPKTIYAPSLIIDGVSINVGFDFKELVDYLCQSVGGNSVMVDIDFDDEIINKMIEIGLALDKGDNCVASQKLIDNKALILLEYEKALEETDNENNR